MWYKIWLKDLKNMPQSTYQLAASPNGTSFDPACSISKDQRVRIAWCHSTEPVATDYFDNMWGETGIRVEPFSALPHDISVDLLIKFDEHLDSLDTTQWPFDE